MNKIPTFQTRSAWFSTTFRTLNFSLFRHIIEFSYGYELTGYKYIALGAFAVWQWPTGCGACSIRHTTVHSTHTGRSKHTTGAGGGGFVIVLAEMSKATTAQLVSDSLPIADWSHSRARREEGDAIVGLPALRVSINYDQGIPQRRKCEVVIWCTKSPPQVYRSIIIIFYVVIKLMAFLRNKDFIFWHLCGLWFKLYFFVMLHKQLCNSYDILWNSSALSFWVLSRWRMFVAQSRTVRAFVASQVPFVIVGVY